MSSLALFCAIFHGVATTIAAVYYAIGDTRNLSPVATRECTLECYFLYGYSILALFPVLNVRSAAVRGTHVYELLQVIIVDVLSLRCLIDIMSHIEDLHQISFFLSGIFTTTTEKKIENVYLFTSDGILFSIEIVIIYMINIVPHLRGHRHFSLFLFVFLMADKKRSKWDLLVSKVRPMTPDDIGKKIVKVQSTIMMNGNSDQSYCMPQIFTLLELEVENVTDEKKEHEIQFELNCWRCSRPLKYRNLCTRCKRVSYCNIECQKEDWRVHKGLCRPPVYARITRMVVRLETDQDYPLEKLCKKMSEPYRSGWALLDDVKAIDPGLNMRDKIVQEPSTFLTQSPSWMPYDSTGYAYSKNVSMMTSNGWH
jgi:hypothetical protein